MIWYTQGGAVESLDTMNQCWHYLLAYQNPHAQVQRTSTSSHARPCTLESSAILITLPVVTVLCQQFRIGGRRIRYTVSCVDLRINLYSAIFWDQLLRDWHPLNDWDILADNSIMLHAVFKLDVFRLRML
jgi:hypothetical protein